MEIPTRLFPETEIKEILEHDKAEAEVKELLERYIAQDDHHQMRDASGHLIEELRTQKDKAFKEKLDAVSTPLPKITWKILQDFYNGTAFFYGKYLAISYGNNVLFHAVLPLTGIEIMASLPGSEFDVSLLEHYRKALAQWQLLGDKNRNLLNLPDILNAVSFLLNDQKEIQEQCGMLLYEGTTEYYNAGSPAFTSEKFAQLLFLCRETNLEQGRAIFEQHASKIKVTAAFLSTVISSFSDESFQWCVQKWFSENSDQQLPQEVMSGVLTHYRNAILDTDKSVYATFLEVVLMTGFFVVRVRLGRLRNDLMRRCFNFC